MKMCLSRDNYSQTRDQNIVEDEINIMSALNYNKSTGYKNIGITENMNLRCNFYYALKCSKGPSGFCCSGGKVLLAEMSDPTEPTNSLLNHYRRDSKHFLDMNRVHNSSF